MQDLYRKGYFDGFHQRQPAQHDQPYYMHGYQSGQRVRELERSTRHG